MEAIALLFAFACLLAVLLAGFFATFVLPVWGIIQVAGSQRSGGAKTAWILGMLMTGVLVSLIYGLFCASPGLKRTTRFFTVIFIMGMAASFGVASYLQPKFAERKAANQAAQLAESNADVRIEGLKVLEKNANQHELGFDETLTEPAASTSGAGEAHETEYTVVRSASKELPASATSSVPPGAGASLSQAHGEVIESRFPQKYYKLEQPGPHRGMLIRLDADKHRYLEVVLERGLEKLTLYLFDSELKPIMSDQNKVKAGQTFPAVPGQLRISGWTNFVAAKKRNNSAFVSTREEYKTRPFGGRIEELQVEGSTYENIMYDFAAGETHDDPQEQALRDAAEKRREQEQQSSAARLTEYSQRLQRSLSEEDLVALAIVKLMDSDLDTRTKGLKDLYGAARLVGQANYYLAGIDKPGVFETNVEPLYDKSYSVFSTGREDSIRWPDRWSSEDQKSEGLQRATDFTESFARALPFLIHTMEYGRTSYHRSEAIDLLAKLGPGSFPIILERMKQPNLGTKELSNGIKALSSYRDQLPQAQSLLVELATSDHDVAGNAAQALRSLELPPSLTKDLINRDNTGVVAAATECIGTQIFYHLAILNELAEKSPDPNTHDWCDAALQNLGVRRGRREYSSGLRPPWIEQRLAKLNDTSVPWDQRLAMLEESKLVATQGAECLAKAMKHPDRYVRYCVSIQLGTYGLAPEPVLSALVAGVNEEKISKRCAKTLAALDKTDPVIRALHAAQQTPHEAARQTIEDALREIDPSSLQAALAAEPGEDASSDSVAAATAAPSNEQPEPQEAHPDQLKNAAAAQRVLKSKLLTNGYAGEYLVYSEAESDDSYLFAVLLPPLYLQHHSPLLFSVGKVPPYALAAFETAEENGNVGWSQRGHKFSDILEPREKISIREIYATPEELFKAFKSAAMEGDFERYAQVFAGAGKEKHATRERMDVIGKGFPGIDFQGFEPLETFDVPLLPSADGAGQISTSTLEFGYLLLGRNSEHVQRLLTAKLSSGWRLIAD